MRGRKHFSWQIVPGILYRWRDEECSPLSALDRAVTATSITEPVPARRRKGMLGAQARRQFFAGDTCGSPSIVDYFAFALPFAACFFGLPDRYHFRTCSLTAFSRSSLIDSR